MNQKLIAFDIDGTLLDTTGHILPSTLEALEKLRAAGHIVTIATGRSRFLARQVIAAGHFDNYLILNGAAAFVNGQQIVKTVLDREELVRLVDFADTVPTEIIYQSLDDLYRHHEEILPSMKAAMDSFRADVPSFDANFHKTHEVYQAIGHYPESLDAAFGAQHFAKFDFVRWHPLGVDIVPHNNSKGVGLLKMAEAVGIAQADLIVFGDGLNDCDMLSKAGLGISMGNGLPEAKAAADYVTDDNDSDGIVNALKHFDLI